MTGATITTNTIKAAVFDVAGNSSTAASQAVVLDQTAPTAVASIVSLSADTGTASDFITNTASQTISGTYTNTIGAGETLKVSLDNGSTWVAASTATGGAWTLTGATITTNTLQAAVFDTAGNASTADTQAVVLDTTLPTLSSFTPTDNSTAVAISSNIVLTFSETVTAVTGNNVSIYTTTGNTLITAIDAANAQISITGGVVTINPTADLANNTEYYVLIEADAFKDVANNTYSGQASTAAISFTTAALAPTNTNITISNDNGTSTATAGVDTFNIAKGTYSHTINGFDAGDKLVLFPNAIFNLTNDTNQTDGIQEFTVTDSATNATTTIILTGLAGAQDSGLFQLQSFDIVFGTGTVSYQ